MWQLTIACCKLYIVASSTFVYMYVFVLFGCNLKCFKYFLLLKVNTKQTCVFSMENVVNNIDVWQWQLLLRGVVRERERDKENCKRQMSFSMSSVVVSDNLNMCTFSLKFWKVNF